MSIQSQKKVIPLNVKPRTCSIWF